VKQQIKSTTTNQQIDKANEAPFYLRCSELGYYNKDCRKGLQENKNDNENPGTFHGNRKYINEFVAPLCATQVEGQAFSVSQIALQKLMPGGRGSILLL
jgi:hypothetical protein